MLFVVSRASHLLDHLAWFRAWLNVGDRGPEFAIAPGSGAGMVSAIAARRA
jgi:hypothetical protein